MLSSRPPFAPSHLLRTDPTCSSWRLICSQVFLFALIDSSEAGLDAEDCISTAFQDWQVDSGGADALSHDAFGRSWFQMADLNVQPPRDPIERSHTASRIAA